MTNIRDALKKLAGNGGELVSLVCTVDAVDKEARTIDCTPLNDESPLLGVNLQANQASEVGVVIYPVVGSYVVVGFMSGGAAGAVLLTDEIEGVDIAIGDSALHLTLKEEEVNVNIGEDISINMSKEEININGGSFRGLVKIAELEDNLSSLKTYVETLKSAVNTGLDAVGISTAASGTLGAQAFNTAMATSSITIKDMEDKKVKH